MSYIRATSNPEALYVYESIHGVEFWHGLPKHLASDPPIIIQPDLFKTMGITWLLCNVYPQYLTLQRVKYVKKELEKLQAAGLSLKETFVFYDTGEETTSFCALSPADAKRTVRALWKLSYKHQYLYLWKVTLESLFRSLPIHEVPCDELETRLS